MRRACGLLIVPFAWMMLGADDCLQIGPIGQTAPPSAQSAPALPYCNADPPVGCAAVCVAVDDVELNSACSDIGANTRADQFAMDVQTAIDALHAKGLYACNDAQVGVASVTPCQDGLAPLEWPNQDHATCTPPPAGCIVSGQ
jgi:hypothetical protein